MDYGWLSEEKNLQEQLCLQKSNTIIHIWLHQYDSTSFALHFLNEPDRRPSESQRRQERQNKNVNIKHTITSLWDALILPRLPTCFSLEISTFTEYAIKWNGIWRWRSAVATQIRLGGGLHVTQTRRLGGKARIVQWLRTDEYLPRPESNMPLDKRAESLKHLKRDSLRSAGGEVSAFSMLWVIYAAFWENWWVLFWFMMLFPHNKYRLSSVCKEPLWNVANV